MKHELVSDDRAQQLSLFAVEFEILCAKYNLDVYASADADMIEIVERGFSYPEGYGYSATMTGVVEGKMDCFRIDRQWDDEDEEDEGATE